MTYLRRMNYSLVLAAIVIIALVTFAVMPRIAYAQTQTTGTVLTAKMNVRAGSSAGYAILAALKQGDSVPVLGRNPDGSWVMIRLPDGRDGWATSLYLNMPVSVQSLSVIPNSIVEPAAFVGDGSVNLRAGPGLNFAVVRILGVGHVMSMLGRTSDSNWVRVRVDGLIGWIASGVISPSVPVSSLPVVSAPPPPTATPIPTAAPTSTPGGPTETPAPTSPPPGFGTARVTTAQLNVRSGPGPGYLSVGTVKENDLVTLLARNANSSWIKIRTASNLEGWVSSLYLFILPPATATQLPVVADVEPAATVNTGTVNVRSGPGPEFAVLTTANFGTNVNMVARNASGTWVKIRLNGQLGWVDATYLSTNFIISFLPIATQ